MSPERPGGEPEPQLEASSSARRRSLAPSAVLGRVELFQGLEPSALEEIARSMRPREHGPGDEICRQGEDARALLVIVDGLVHALREGEPVARRRHGDVVGAAALVTGEPYGETVVARTPTQVLELDAEAYGAAVARHPRILRNVTGILRRRLATATARRTRRGERGEAVALVVSPELMSVAPDVLSAARAASARPLDVVDTVVGLQAKLAELDDRLAESATVVLTAGLAQESAPLVVEHADRTVALVAGPAELERVRLLDAGLAAGGTQTTQVVMLGDGASGPWPLEAGGVRVTRALERGEDRPLDERDLAWLGRRVAGVTLGLALGAGGAKGYAHVGALHALEEAGYTVDYVSGSSIGAIVAACVAAGMTAAEVENALREAFTPERIAEMFSLSLAGGSTGLEATERALRELAGGRSFDELEIPLTVMTVDIGAGEPAPLREGPVWQALMGATALAGMFPPYELHGRRLVDGLHLVPVPTTAVVDTGADVTVSVNLMSRDVLRAWPGDEEPPEQPEVVQRRGSRILDTLLAVLDLANLDNSIRHAGLADVVVTPRFGPCTWKDFQLADHFLEAGRQAAGEQLEALRTLARPAAAAVTT